MLTISGDAVLVWDIAPSGTNHPAWLTKLAEAVSGQVLNRQGLLEPSKLDRVETMKQIRADLQREQVNDDWILWGRWFLADPSTRTISPFSKVTMPEYIENRIKENTPESLAEAEQLASGNAELLSRVSQARAAVTTPSPRTPNVLLTPVNSQPSTNDQTVIDQDKTVRVVYLVSQDRQVQTNYLQAVENAIHDLQGWYSRQLGGPTFKLHNPVVEVAKSSQTADWFYSHTNGVNRDDWGYNNTFAEASRLLGARLNDPHYVWVIYSDGPGNKGRGGSGVTCLPEDDLLGLIGKHPTQKDPQRWIGGLGHELGHAFGLPHPADTVRDADAIMWAGFYGKYPNGAYLTEQDKGILLHSSFFFDTAGRPMSESTAFVEKYTYAGGYFGKLTTNNPARWKEGKTDSTEAYYFEELKRDDQVVLLRDASRGMTIQIPLPGGESRFSWDDGATWSRLYDVQKE